MQGNNYQYNLISFEVLLTAVARYEHLVEPPKLGYGPAAKYRPVFPQNWSNCVALSLVNLADPSWISINCTAKILYDVLCATEKRKVALDPINTAPEREWCSKHFILRNNSYYSFVWTYYFTLSKNPHCYLNFTEFFHLFNAVAATRFPPICTFNKKLMTFTRHVDIYKYELNYISNESTEGLCIVQQTGLYKRKMTGNMFECRYGIYISAQFVCDGISDCPGKTPFDEIICQCHRSTKITKHFQHYISSRRRVCSPLYSVSNNQECRAYLSTQSQVKTTHQQVTITRHVSVWQWEITKYWLSRWLGCRLRSAWWRWTNI